MHTVELLGEAIALTKKAGYRIRQEWLGGTGGGGCEIQGRKYLFLDLALGPEEQFQQVLDTLRREPMVASLPISPPLRAHLFLRKSA